MADRTRPSFAALALWGLAVAAAPLAVSAQTAQFYSPPKVTSMGSPSSAIVGNGTVQLQVFVHKDGSIGAIKVEKSTNHGDDAAAVEIARSSKYKPGERDAKPIDAFYTFRIKFSGSSFSADTGSTSGDVNQANALIRAGKYAEARTALQTYLAGHAGDKDAEALLGVADAYLNDASDATAAFDAAGTIPDRFKTVAAKAYTDAAVDALKARKNDEAIALADKALALQQSVNTLFVRGTAYANEQKYQQGLADLEKAKAEATSGHADASTLNLIDSGLVSAYLLGGQSDKGLALAADLKRRDPSNTRVDDALAAYYNQQASQAVQGGKRDQAVSLLEAGAKAVPSRAAIMYDQAANVLASDKTPDWKRVKAEADKALAVAPTDAVANFIAGVSLANSGDKNGAITYLQKAKANVGSDAKLAGDIDTALKQLGQKTQ
ncbi:MAG: energy transducer TonB [Candidatus Eremiobacteraeota bacterium]|nr:energy transducer TonB [Candidatus Eremiobacteraeota bacterium]